MQATQTYFNAARTEIGKHKVPTLRNVDKRFREAGPIVHVLPKLTGIMATSRVLKQIVHFYNTRDVLPCGEQKNNPGVDCWPPPEVGLNMNTKEWEILV